VRVNFGYDDKASGSHHGSADLTAEDLLDLFHRFEGKWASLYLIVDNQSMFAWLKHGPEMYEVQWMDHVQKRKRLGQVPNRYAEDLLQRVARGNYALDDLEQNARLYSAGVWDPSMDVDYWACRSRHWPRRLDPAP
jgi:hypothetical protein